MNTTNVPAKVQTLINKAYLAIKEKRPEWFPVIQETTWEMNTRVRRVLGRAFLFRNKIELGYHYAMNANEESVYNTIIHELAHLIAFKVYMDKGHGYMWKMVHSALGGNAQRTADSEETGLTIKKNKVKRIILEKNGKEYKATVKLYNRCPEAYTRMGYRYLRTILIDNGVETIIHSHKETAIFLDSNLNTVAAHSAT
jgi:predicted SprT family Zn-dependent metalloprotease